MFVPRAIFLRPEVRNALDGIALGWATLGYVTTVVGNLTLVRSVADLIVEEGAREHHHLVLVEYLRFGLPSKRIRLAVGAPILGWTAT